ncbi:lipoyl synthase [Leptolyngbya sp. 7M]|uniref:lipoyl synthase n=1 Tax=Leptolyngbya sp. 7M TaxID=2812896 RepID=UPI0021F0EC66|nr:lipoyl synthase [Leptolyngbya sp. 7M]
MAEQVPTELPPAGTDPIARTLARHPRPLGGDPLRRVDRPVVSLSGMVLNNDSNQQLATKKKPSWLRAKVPGGPGYTRLKSILSEHRLHTVCEEAGCPNMGECWSRGVATIMILGDTCTRACGFCNVKTGRPAAVDKDEPRRVAESLRLMQEGAHLKHIVITSVNRDELPDGGAGIWAETILRTRELCPGLSIEVLIPDFEGNWAALQMVIDARPHIINHNLETVRRMYPAVRPSAKFDRSIELLRRVKEQGLVAKTGIMVGIGETDEEVIALMQEVQQGTRVESDQPGRADACDILTIGQYLQPTRNHLPIDRWVTPEQFRGFQEQGLRHGFKVVESGALVRSSYHADHQADELTDVLDERETQMRRRMAELLGRG